MEKEVKYGEDGKPEADTGGLSQYVMNLFSEFKTSRQPFEDMWIECWWNYLGQYQKDLNWRPETEGENGNSRIFIKATTVKCNTAHAKVMDMAFSKDGGESVPFAGEPIMLPIHEQMGITPEQLKEASKRMIDKIKGHHKAIDLIEQIDTATLEMAILGTAVIKGPMLSPVKDTKYSVRTIMGMPVNALDPSMNPYQRTEETVHRPDFTHIPLWGYYCDPNAKSAKDSVMEMHYDRMLPGDFAKFCSTGGFIEENVKAAEARAGGGAGDDANLKYVQLGDNYMGEEGEKDKRIPVLEAWGWVKVSHIKPYAKEGTLPTDAKDDDYIEAGVWLAADGICIKACVNTLGRRPFKVCPWKKVPHQVFGHGVAWSMRDSQKMINSSMRMIIDNKALTGPGMLAVNMDRINTKKTRNMKVYPKKVWYVKGNFAPKDAIDTVKFTDVTRELRELRMDFERFADEETSIPKLEEGQQASFLNKTAAGMSMLMGRTNVNIKPAIKNIDDFWIEPIVEEEYLWFMDMEPDQSIKIPMKIRATGISTLIANEIKMENYAKFMQVTGANPQDAIMVDREKAIRNWAAMLDTEDIMRTPEQIKELLDMAAKEGDKPKDIKEYIAIDKVFPLLTASEQNQIVQMIGIQPDTQGRGVLGALQVQKLQADIAKTESDAQPEAPKAPEPEKNNGAEQELLDIKIEQARVKLAEENEKLLKLRGEREAVDKANKPRKRKFSLQRTADGNFEGNIHDEEEVAAE
jgi:hypothetical protein